MTPEQRFIAKWVAIALLFIGVFLGGFAVRGYMAEHDATVVQLAAEQSKTQALAQAIDTIADRDAQIQVLQDDLHKLDVTSTKALNDAHAKNTALSRDLDVAQRMRFTGGICPTVPATGHATEAGTVGDGAGVELSAAGRQDVFHLRGNITTNEAKVTYLQGHITILDDWIARQRWCGLK